MKLLPEPFRFPLSLSLSLSLSLFSFRIFINIGKLFKFERILWKCVAVKSLNTKLETGEFYLAELSWNYCTGERVCDLCVNFNEFARLTAFNWHEDNYSTMKIPSESSKFVIDWRVVEKWNEILRKFYKRNVISAFIFFLFSRATYVRVLCELKRIFSRERNVFKADSKKEKEEKREENVTRFSHDKRTRECVSLDLSRSNDH